ncbi:hypothetical protein BDV97DRAFT_402425 [Delphinella strobiligena]|nr:hypothetical protein BDV97DRAFT_402425 [Delphinella strobiligena]
MHFFNLFTYAGLLVVSHASSIAFIPPQHTYLLTSSFSTNISESWTVSTTTTNFSLNSVVNGAQNASFIVYDQEFSSIIGDQPNLTLVEQRADQFAAEGGVWAFDRNEVWFSSGVVGEDATSIYVLNLSNNTITHPTFTGDPIPNANGGYYYNRTVYFTTAGNANQVASVVSINPATKVATTIVNLYFDFASISLMMWPNIQKPTIQNAVWRFDPQRQYLRPVIPRSDAAISNGVRVNAEGTKLYVTDNSYWKSSGFANSSFGEAAVYEYELNDDALPLDDAANVWTAEYEGIYVRNKYGKVLGVINATPLLVPGSSYVIENFALAGDTLVILAAERLWTLKLAKQIVAPGNPFVEWRGQLPGKAILKIIPVYFQSFGLS